LSYIIVPTHNSGQLKEHTFKTITDILIPLCSFMLYIVRSILRDT